MQNPDLKLIEDAAQLFRPGYGAKGAQMKVAGQPGASAAKIGHMLGQDARSIGQMAKRGGQVLYDTTTGGLKAAGNEVAAPIKGFYQGATGQPLTENVPSMADAEVPGSRTASANPMVPAPPQSGPVQRSPTQEPAIPARAQVDRSAYSLKDAAKDFTILPDQDAGTSTAMDMQGNSMQGINKPGGTFSTISMPAPDLDSLRKRNAISKANAYNALPEGQRGRMPNDVADVMGVARAPERGQASGAGSNPTMREAVQSYLSGDVGGEGYRMARNMKMKQESAARDLPRGRARNAALAEIAADPFSNVLEGGQTGTPALSPANQLGLARLGLDTQFKSQEAQRKAMNDQYTRQKDAYQMKRDAARDEGELRDASRERADEIITDGSRFAPELQQVGPQLLRQSVNKNMDVDSVADAMNALLAEDTPAMAETRKSLLDDDEETQRAAQKSFAEMFARKQGWDQ